MRSFGVVRGLAVAIAVCLVPLGAARQGGTFKSNVNMFAVDVIVVDRDGQPVIGLQPGDFEVRINNQIRRVASADLVQYSANATPGAGGAGDLPALVQPILTPGIVPADARVFVIAVDDASFSTGGLRPAVQAAQRFVDHLRPSDMVGLYVYPFERPQVALVHDHRAVRNALGRLFGRREPMRGEFEIGPSEIMEITAENGDTLRRVVARECPTDPTCPLLLRAEASMKAGYYEAEAAQRIFGLSALFQDLITVPGRKTVVVVSGGLLSAAYGGRPDVRPFMRALGAQAARSNVGTYVVHVDNTFSDTFSVASGPSRGPGDRITNLMSDEGAFADGLEKLASEAGGAFLPVKAGTSDSAFNRILRETMAYYLLGVEPTQADWDGRTLMVKVKLKTSVRGVTVRALREVIPR